jgi:uncharacterized protein involved in type VI secretion and phage assembly
MVDLVRAEIAETEDPSGRGRAQISAPLLFGESRYWAEVLRPAGGATPAYRIGDVVIVGFEDGDRDRPIILGSVGSAT